jgi:hypothetical protein
MYFIGCESNNRCIFAANNNYMLKAVISGDIVAYTSLSDDDRTILEESLKVLLEKLKRDFNVYGRIIKGDYLEFVVLEPENALRVALIIKSFVKSIHVTPNLNKKADKRIKFFKTYGIRLAIGYGNLSRYDPEKGIIDGEAIYMSGRAINEEVTYNKERIVIKNTLFFVSANEKLNNEFESLLSLIDVLMSKATVRQSEVLNMKLLNYNEEAIAQKMEIAQPVVNQHSTSVGWNAIEKAIIHFSRVIKGN